MIIKLRDSLSNGVPCKAVATLRLRPSVEQAERLRQSALLDRAAGRYASAYKKIVKASGLNPDSRITAADRRSIVELYRRQLQRYIYGILSPWLFFPCFLRSEAYPLPETWLFSSQVACLVAIGTALCIHRRKERVQ